MDTPTVPAQLIIPPAPTELDRDARQIVQEIGEVIADMAKGRVSPTPQKTKIPVIKSRYLTSRGSWQLSNDDAGISTTEVTKPPPRKISIRPYTGGTKSPKRPRVIRNVPLKAKIPIQRLTEVLTQPINMDPRESARPSVPSTSKMTTLRSLLRPAKTSTDQKESIPSTAPPTTEVTMSKPTQKGGIQAPAPPTTEVTIPQPVVKSFIKKVPMAAPTTSRRKTRCSLLKPDIRVSNARESLQISTPNMTGTFVPPRTVVATGIMTPLAQKSGRRTRLIPIITIPDSPARRDSPILSAAVATITNMETETIPPTISAQASFTPAPATSAPAAPTLPPTTGGKRKPKRSCRNRRHGLRYHHDGVALWKATWRGGVIEWAEVVPKNACREWVMIVSQSSCYLAILF
ncbi:hypothetical protein PV327_010920 [Microctonus hyperodae]|uniref:Uncharacterized protein n=1 Tax=Microctonus hyperodae TaxID=165561 RepID=A0AA39EZC7_MICHY|nr:hypothetical protein PV327_010920 [Microctonus hyperodae]